MLVYVAHTDLTQEDIQEARKLVRHLQMKYPEDCFLCPIFAFSPIASANISGKQYELIRQDLLSACDLLLICSPTDNAMRQDIACAKRMGLGVKRIAKP